MTATVFLVLLLSAYWIKARSIEAAVLDLYLPIFLLGGSFIAFRLPHLPTINFAYAAVIPIAGTLLIWHWREWRFTRTDLWLALFMGGAALTEILHSDNGTAGLILFDGIFQGVMPYMVGKMLLEKDGLRERFVRRWVHISVFVAIISIWEFRMGTNLFNRVEGMIFGSYNTFGAVRGGFVRAGGTFGGPIQAGCMFGAAMIMSLWLGVLDKSRGNERTYFGIRRATLITMGAALGVLIANSRGPEVGLVLAFLIARMGKAKNFRLSLILTLCLTVVGGGIGYIKAMQYTSGSISDAKNQDQENAIYRRVLLDEYKSYIKEGGLLGYGVVARPIVPGMFSIDNAFLNFQLLQGNLGLWTFILLGSEGVLASFRAARRATQRNDVCFAMCMCGALAGLILTLTTVYLGTPMYSLFFLLVGWSQSLRQTEEASVTAPQPVNARFAFRRVIA
ncbi:MAG: hypothetical protein JO300_13905 [Silvibacterium sp.]|nr:hypothetical protein [Silvibacterium sp.]MBV8436638.1 hypothetical protein [Silvibacterium sp.]